MVAVPYLGLLRLETLFGVVRLEDWLGKIHNCLFTVINNEPAVLLFTDS